MASFNKITIVGYLGRDPEIRYTPSGEAVCNFSIATTERRKDNTGEYQDQTTWFRVTIWGKRGEAANQYLTKGKQAYIEGRLRQQEYTDRDGKLRTSLEVTATDIQFLGPRGEEGGGMGTNTSLAARTSSTRPLASDSNDEPSVHDDEIPF